MQRSSDNIVTNSRHSASWYSTSRNPAYLRCQRSLTGVKSQGHPWRSSPCWRLWISRGQTQTLALLAHTWPALCPTQTHTTSAGPLPGRHAPLPYQNKFPTPPMDTSVHYGWPWLGARARTSEWAGRTEERAEELQRRELRSCRGRARGRAGSGGDRRHLFSHSWWESWTI